MKTIYILKRIVASILMFASSFTFAAESVEPALQYTLEINNQQHDLVLNQPITLNGNYNNPKIVLKAAMVKKFTYGNVMFDYPAYFSWEADIVNANKKSWTLSGNDFKIMFFVFPQRLSLDGYVGSLAKSFGEDNTRIENMQRTLGTEKLKGKKLFVIIAGTAVNLEVYPLPTKSGTRFLVLQDSPNKGDVSKEG